MPQRGVELLAPAGGMRQLAAALRFGADAVYVGLPNFGLRARAANFDDALLSDAAALVHKEGRRLYVTLNAYLWDDEFDELRACVRRLAAIPVDAVIVSDPGAVAMLRESVPELELHLSTQANTTNARAASLWHSMGVSRVVLSRELSLERIRRLRELTPPDLVLEAFVHGAMCAAVSGRCLLSANIAGRSANRGECAQPCRWLWKPVRSADDEHHDEMIIEQCERGTYFASAYDLCMMERLPELIGAGVTSLKIEGRMKNEYAVAALVQAYRAALDNPGRAAQMKRELGKISQRATNTGFYYGVPEPAASAGPPSQTMEYIARVESVEDCAACVTVKGKFAAGEDVEALTPAGAIPFKVEWVELDGFRINQASVPELRVRLPVPQGVAAGDMLRAPDRNHRR